ncbi:hypothetical protein [Derxia lacustris]|uniref:hypothetical protein n=1 Tax=Derxia lacustris TaxID=764842 RepID=UPI000A173161|nr:hypothetical protein [Derxia lacustris]
MSNRPLVAALLISTACVFGTLVVLDGRMARPAAENRAVTPVDQPGPVVAAPPQALAPQPAPTPPRPGGEVWRCTGAGGAISYSDRPCAGGDSRSVDTRDALRGWDGSRELELAQRRAAAPAAPRYVPIPASAEAPADDDHLACADIAAAIAAYNVDARQPRSGQRQDQIRAALTALRDQRSQLGCRTLD